MGDLGDLISSSSPLTGGYLLVVLAEPHSEHHKEALLKRLAKGLLSWDVQETQIDIESELQNIAAQCPQGEDVRNGEKLIQIASDSLVTEILIHPQVNTFKQCLRNLMASFTRHRHIVHAGYTLSGSGSWILQDGLFDSSDFLEILQDPEVQRLLRAYEPGTITMDMHCMSEGDWTLEYLNKDPAAKSMKMAVNPADRLALSSSGLTNFVQYISDILPAISLEKLLEPSDVVGNIRFSHPTLYVFPGGQGDSALFGISGFNILVDGGFGRKPCFWDFTRHLDRLDAVVMTRFNTSSLSGLTGAIDRKATSPVYPQVGHIFCNIPQEDGGMMTPSPDGDKDSADPLLIHVADVCHSMYNSLNRLQLKPQSIYRSRTIEPVNLYHKVGHGSLDMYVISPSLHSSEVKDFMRMWANGEAKGIGAAKRTIKMGGREFQIPLLDLISVCALLIWQPADPAEPVTRILFPGSAPQHKILEGLEKIRHLEFMKAPVYTAKSLITPPASAVPPKMKAKSSAVNSSSEKLMERKTAPASRTGGVADVVEVRQLVKSFTSAASSASKAKTETKDKPSKSVSELKKSEKSKTGDSKEGLEKEAEQNKSISEKSAAVKKMKSADSADGADKPRAKSSDVKSRIDSHLITSRTDSGEIRRSKADSKPKVNKETPALKKEPSSSSSSVVNGAVKGTPPLKIKKEVANMKVVEAKVNSFKGTTSSSSSSGASGKKSADAESKEPVKKRPVTKPKEDAVKEVKKTVDKPKSPKDETKEVRPKTKTDKSETKSKEAAESKPKLIKPKPKAAEPKSTSKSTTSEVKTEAKEKPKVAKSETKVKKETPKPKETSRPASAKPKSAADKKTKSDKPPAGSSQPVPIIKSVKRPPKPAEVAGAAVVAGAVAAVAAAAVAASAAESDATAVEVVEEAIVATEAAEAASAPPAADDGEVQSAEVSEESVLDAIESEIIAATEAEEADEAPAADDVPETEAAEEAEAEAVEDEAVETEAAAEEDVAEEVAVEEEAAAEEVAAEDATEEAEVEEEVAVEEEAVAEEASAEEAAAEDVVTEEAEAEEETAVEEEAAAEEDVTAEEEVAAEEESAVEEEAAAEEVAAEEEVTTEEVAAEEEVATEEAAAEEETAVEEEVVEEADKETAVDAGAEEEATEDAVEEEATAEAVEESAADEVVEEDADNEAVEEVATEEEIVEDEVVEEVAVEEKAVKEQAGKGDEDQIEDAAQEAATEEDAIEEQATSDESKEEKLVEELTVTKSEENESQAEDVESEVVAEEQETTREASAVDPEATVEEEATEGEDICGETDEIEPIKSQQVDSVQVDHGASTGESEEVETVSSGAEEQDVAQESVIHEASTLAVGGEESAAETAQTPVQDEAAADETHEEEVVVEVDATEETELTLGVEVDVAAEADEVEDKKKVVDADKDLDETELVVKKESIATPAEVKADNLIKAERKPSSGDNKVETAECMARSDQNDVRDDDVDECLSKETHAPESVQDEADEIEEDVDAGQTVAVEAQSIDLDYRGQFETSAADAGDNLQLNVGSVEATSLGHDEELSSMDSQPADYEFKKGAQPTHDVQAENSIPDSGPPSMEFSVNLATEPRMESQVAAVVKSQPSNLDLSLGSADEVDEEFTAEKVTKPSPVFDTVSQDDLPAKSPVKAESPVKKQEKASPVQETAVDSGDEGVEVQEEFYQEIKKKEIESEVSQQQTAELKESLTLPLDNAAPKASPTEDGLREIEAAVEMTGRKLLEDIVSHKEDQERLSPQVQTGSSSVKASPNEQPIDTTTPVATRDGFHAEQHLLEAEVDDVQVAVNTTDQEAEPDAESTDVGVEDAVTSPTVDSGLRRNSSHGSVHQTEPQTPAADDDQVQVSQLTAQSAEYVTVSAGSSAVASPKTPLAPPLSDGSQSKSPVDEVKSPASPVKVETTVTESSPTSPVAPKSPLHAEESAVTSSQQPDDVHEEFDHKVRNMTELSLTVTDTASGVSSTPVSPRSVTPKSPLSPRQMNVSAETPIAEEEPQKLLTAAQLSAVPITPSTSSPKAPLTPQPSAEIEEPKEVDEVAATWTSSTPKSPLSPRPSQEDEQLLASNEQSTLVVQVPASAVTPTSSPKSPLSPAGLQSIDAQPLLMKVEDKTPLSPKSPLSPQATAESIEERVESPVVQETTAVQETSRQSICSSPKSSLSPRLTEQVADQTEEQITSTSSTPRAPLSPRPADQDVEETRSLSVAVDKVASATSTPKMPLSPRQVETEDDQADAKSASVVSTPKSPLSPRPEVQLKVSVDETKSASPLASPIALSPRPAEEKDVEAKEVSAPLTPKSPLSPRPAEEKDVEVKVVSAPLTPKSPLSPRPEDKIETPKSSPSPLPAEQVESSIIASPISPKTTLQTEELTVKTTESATSTPKSPLSPHPTLPAESAVEETVASVPATPKSPLSPRPVVETVDKPEELTLVESLPAAVTPKSPLSPRPADQLTEKDDKSASASSSPKAPLSPRLSVQVDVQDDLTPKSPSSPRQQSEQVEQKVASAAPSPLPSPRLDEPVADKVETPKTPLSPRLTELVIESAEKAIESTTPKSPFSPTEKVADPAESPAPKTPVSPRPSQQVADAVESAFESSIPKSPVSPRQSVAEVESAVGSSAPKSPSSPRLAEQSDKIESFAESAPKSPLSPKCPVQSDDKAVPDANARSPLPEETSQKSATAVEPVSQSAHVETDLVSPATASTTYFDGYLLQYEGVQSSGTRLSTIASSGDVDTDSVSLDSNFSSRTYDKITSSWKADDANDDPAPSAFSSGPSSWDVCEKDSLKTIITTVPADDQSATSSIVSHVTEDYTVRMELDRASIISQDSSFNETLAERREAKPIESLLTPLVGDSSLIHDTPSPVPSSPFSAEAKDSMSSLQTDSSDFGNLSESKVDDSASSMQSEYSDRISDRAPTTPFSDTSNSSSYKEDRTVLESVMTKSGSGLKESAKAAFDSGLDISAPAEFTTVMAASIGEVAITHHSDFEETTIDPKQHAGDNQWAYKEEPFSQTSNVISAHYDAPVEERYSEAERNWERQQYYPAPAESDSLQGESADPSVPSDYSGDYYGHQYTYYDEQQQSEGLVVGDDRQNYEIYESDVDDRGSYGYGKYAETADYDDYQPHEHEGDHQNGNSYHYYREESSSQSTEGVQPYVDPNRNDPASPRGAADSFVQPPAFVDAAPSRQEGSHVDDRPAPQQQQQQQQQQQPSVSHEETVASWGKPLGLPTPVAPAPVNGVDNKKSASSAGMAVNSPLKRAKMATSAAANGNGGNTSAAAPFYVDLAYIPHHGDPKYCDVEFFKRIRARHYVLSTLEPSAQVLEALLEGKQSWTGSDKELDVTIIPTYDSDALGQWVSANEEVLARNRIDLAPSASRCTINLQDHETSCSAYRLEF